MTANAFSVGRRVELAPIAASTAVGLLAAAGLFATGVDEATDLAVGLGAGLCADLFLLRLPLESLLRRRIGSPT
jgi:hypothetical protein